MMARVAAIVRRDIAIELSYQLRLIMRLVSLLVTVVFLFYVSEFVSITEGVSTSDGSYFDFVIVGVAVSAYAGIGIGAFISRISQEQVTGTFEALLASTTPISVLLLAGFIVPFAITTIELAVLLGLGLGVMGSGISFGALLASVPLLFVTIVSFCAFGIAGSALVVLAKRGDILSGPLYQATVAFSGVLFPVALFPAAIRPISYAFPSFYGIRGVREMLLDGAGFTDTIDDLLIVFGFCVVLVPASLWLFRRAIVSAKRAGVLGSY